MACSSCAAFTQHVLSALQVLGFFVGSMLNSKASPNDSQHCYKGVVYKAEEAYLIYSIHSHVWLMLQ